MRTWSSLEQVFCLVSSHLRHRGEDVSAVDGRSLYAVAMVDLTVASLLVYFKLRGDWEEKREKEREDMGGEGREKKREAQ